MTEHGRAARWLVGAFAVTILAAAAWIAWSFAQDMDLARARASRGSVLVDTRCGPIEYQEAGTGLPLLMVHGSGGGHDQGMAVAVDLVQRGVRVIAVSRFGYLRTPMPADSSPAAQADAHICLLDALGIRRAAVAGGSAGAPSALQTAIHYPDRVSSLILLVPIAYKPAAEANSAPPMSAVAEAFLMRLIGSDFLFWAAIHVAPGQVIKSVLATPPGQVAAASPREQSRVNAMLSAILPVSMRAPGLRADSVLGRSLPPYALETVRAPTLIISALDDGYGTFASAQYTASRITGSKFIGFTDGGHVWVGHDDEVHAEILKLLASTR